MWFEDLPANYTWSSLWYGYVLCGDCRGIRRPEEECPGCGAPPRKPEDDMLTLPTGEQVRLAYAGAEWRIEDYTYLNMLEREWKRPIIEEDPVFAGGPPPSPRAAIVLLFWTYFETRIERLLRSGLDKSSEALVEDALDRYSSIGARLDRFYKVVFGSTYAKDLSDLGYADLWDHLSKVQKQRNAFIHGNPGAIDDQLVEKVVAELKAEHEAWIAVYNMRRKLIEPA